MLKANTLLIFTTLLLLNLAFAQDDGFVEADAHEHGAALMTLAIEGNVLAIDFISPSFNIVGFEYAPKTDEEKAVVNEALSNLGATENLMNFSNRANCSLVTSNIASEMSDGEGHDEHHDEHGDEHHDEHDKEEHHDEHSDEEHHDEHGAEHHDEHSEEHHGDEKHHDEEHHEEHYDEHSEEGEHHNDEEHHGEHGEEHHDEHGHEATGEIHSEFHASYEFNCKNPNRLAEINFEGLFAQFPNVQDLDLQYVTDDTQGAVELNPSQTVVKF